jgi:hypothetical protein
MRRLILASLVTYLVTGGGGLAAAAPSPSPSPTMSFEHDIAFPGAVDVGDALGVEAEVLGTREGLGQLWEGAEVELAAVTTGQLRLYRWSSDGSEDATAQAIVEIVRFRSADEAAIHGDAVAASIAGPLQSFETDLSADLVATGSWISEEGFGGSTILVQEGPVVAIVSVAQTDAVEMEQASTTMTALALERLSGDEEVGADRQ